MSVLDILIDNFIMIFELIGLLIITFISVHVDSKIKRLTRLAVILLFVSFAAFHIERYTQTFETLSVWRPLLTALKYSVYPFVIIILILIMAIIKSGKKSGWKLLLLIPAVVTIPMYFTSQWTRLVFYFTEENHYAGGIFPDLPYVIFAFYLVMLIAQNLVYLKRYSIRDRIIDLYIHLGAATFVVLTLLFREDNDYTTVFTSALVFYYLFLYIHMASVDALTGLNNRQSYYQDSALYWNKVTAVVSVDMNELKYYNDYFGHNKGDEALITVAGVLRDNAGRHSVVYRVGGDEFVILYTTIGEQEVVNNIFAMKKKMAATPYTCAFGYAMKTSFGSVDDALAEADKKMYFDKAAIKVGIIESGGEVHDRDKKD